MHPDPLPANPVALGNLMHGLGEAKTADRERIGATFRDWTEHSNGRVEITGYAAGSAFPVEVPAPRLHRDRRASTVPPATGLELLFSAAAGSGAYSQGPGGGYARLRTWEAISGIVDVPWPTPVEELAREAENARWITVEPDDPWFDNVAWDTWIVIEAAGRFVALAATDTD
jgi:hypothetical protein